MERKGKAVSQEILMKMPDNAFRDQAKVILKRVPGVQRLLRLKDKNIHTISRIRELSDLIKEHRFVVYHAHSGPGKNEISTCDMIREEVKEWLDLYGTVRLRRATAATVDAPVGAILLYMPQALLRIPSSCEEYLTQVGCKTRNMIRKAQRNGYQFREFVWNDYLDEIYEINTSKAVRQSEPMRGWYREPVQPRYQSKEESEYRRYSGAFKDGKLRAYLHYWICADFAVVKHILGHAQHLKYGIMDNLISYAVRQCIGNPEIQWFHYGRHQYGTSLDSFKKHVGFQGYAVVLDLEGDQELVEYSERMVQTWWRI